MTNEEVSAKVSEYVGYWKRQLRLEDWDITIEVPAHDPKGYAEVTRHQCLNAAHMVVRNPYMVPPASLANNDLEVTVVHEMLHIRFPNVDFPRNSADDNLFELGIERTAQALVALNRGERRP